MSSLTNTTDANQLEPTTVADESLNPLAPLPTAVQSRFLYPFFYAAHRINEAVAILEASQPFEKKVWTCTEAGGPYQDEVFDHVTDFLFSKTNDAGCRYLRISDEFSQAWFHGASLALKDGGEIPFGPNAKIELFLSAYGVGVFSLTLIPAITVGDADVRFTNEDVVNFNYRLAQMQRWSAASIHIQHPSENPAAMALLTEEDRGNLSPAPKTDAPLSQRLGKRGGNFTLTELVDELLRPLSSFELDPTQPMFSVYSVVLFGSEVDFGLPQTRTCLGPLLSAVSQVEEKDHAGAVPDVIGVPNALLNRKHWAAVGQLGAAHLIADQRGDHRFNTQRLARVRDKYFIQFLLALLQRLVLHRAIRQAGELLGVTDSAQRRPVEELRKDLLEFAVGGQFTQTSTRHALHRYYQIARQGLGIPELWTEVRGAIADIDSRHMHERQDELSRSMAANMKATAEVANELAEAGRKMDENLGVVAGVQRMVHYIEMVVVSVYFAHLWHMFADNESLKEWVSQKTHVHGAGNWLVSVGVLFWAVVGFGLALVLGRLLHGHKSHSK